MVNSIKNTFIALVVLQLGLGVTQAQCMMGHRVPQPGGYFVYETSGSRYYLDPTGEKFNVGSQPLTEVPAGEAAIKDPSTDQSYYYYPTTGQLYPVLVPIAPYATVSSGTMSYYFDPKSNKWEVLPIYTPIVQHGLNPEEELPLAITNGDMKTVDDLLRNKHVSPDVYIAGKPALLYLAQRWKLTNAAEDRDMIVEILGYAGKLKDATLESILAGLTDKQYESVLEFLLRYPNITARIDARDDRERTALMKAAGSGDEGAVKLLISKEADINAKDRADHSVLDYAKYAYGKNPTKRQQRIVELLESRGARGAKPGILGWIAGALGFGGS
jgi:hypothetical protein